MSKKQLLTESEVRRFMRLANIPALGKALVTEAEKAVNQIPQDTRRPETAMTEEEMPGMAGDAAPALPAGDMPPEGGMEGGETVEVGGDVDPEKQQAFEAAVQALADAMGIEVELEGQEEHAEEAGEEMHDLDAGGEEEKDEEEGEEEEEGGEEEMQEAAEEDEGMMKEEKEEEEEEDEGKKKEESKKLSEDELVEAVLSRVTARLVAEAKKKKMSVKQKMKAKAEKKKEEKEEKKEKMEEATEAKGGGPLLSKGGNKHDVWKGHADMKMGKGEKGGSGGHKMEDLSAKSEHTVTHGKTNLATKGGNKKK